MEPGSVSDFCPAMERVVTNDSTLSVRIIIIHENKLWVVRRGGKLTTIFYRVDINGSWKWIRDI